MDEAVFGHGWLEVLGGLPQDKFKETVEMAIDKTCARWGLPELSPSTEELLTLVDDPARPLRPSPRQTAQTLPDPRAVAAKDPTLGDMENCG